jgi:hypothetical protein
LLRLEFDAATNEKKGKRRLVVVNMTWAQRSPQQTQLWRRRRSGSGVSASGFGKSKGDEKTQPGLFGPVLLSTPRKKLLLLKFDVTTSERKADKRKDRPFIGS